MEQTLADLRALAKLLDEHDLDEVEIEEDGRRLRLCRRPPGQRATAAAGLPGRADAPPAAPKPVDELIQIEAPMVGTFYRAPAPGAEPYVREGDLVEPGTTLCILEAMKLMNELQAEVRGRVVGILVENGQPVQYGQPLFSLQSL